MLHIIHFNTFGSGSETQLRDTTSGEYTFKLYTVEFEGLDIREWVKQA